MAIWLYQKAMDLYYIYIQYVGTFARWKGIIV